MDSDNRLAAIISVLVCILCCFGFVQIKACNASDNEVKKLTEGNAVKIAEQQAKAKANCLDAGGSYDDRGACYRSVNGPNSVKQLIPVSP